MRRRSCSARPTDVDGGAGWRASLFFGAAVIGWAGAYFSGAWPWLGFASLARSSHGAGAITIVGETRMGTEYGFDEFVFFEGQEIVIDYDAEIHAGSLWFHVFQPWDGVLGDGTTHYVTSSGKGQWTMRVPETGYYHITVEPSVVRGKGKGWDMAYTAWWGARPAVR